MDTDAGPAADSALSGLDNPMKHTFIVALLCLLAACGGSSSSDAPAAAGGVSTPPGTSCTNPEPASTANQNITVNIPTDFDPTANPAQSTKVFFTILLPPRCPGETFPVVLHGHGFGESRTTALAANGDLPSDLPFHASLDTLPGVLPHHGYVVISFDERGHGESVPSNGGGNARLIDPNAETQDARAILDWAYDHAAEFHIQTEPSSGITKDIRVGTLGASYGGGFQMTLAALDGRIDAIVPTNTWHNMLYSLLPGDAVKLAWGGFLSLAATIQSAIVTPLVQTVMNQIGVANPLASTIRTRADLARGASGPTAMPRAVTEQEVQDFFFTHGMDYFESQQAAGLPWGFGESQARLRPVPALFIQANRDVLFNLTESYWNLRYFSAAGGDARLLTNEGGHMNPAAGQVGGDGRCGQVDSIAAVLAWYDHYLKGVNSAAFQAIPKVCISVADTVGAPDVPAAGLLLQNFPVGSLSGPGAVPAQSPTLNATVTVGALNPTFVPVITIQGNDKVLAGAPRIGNISVTAGQGSLQTAIAFVGVGISRGGQTFLVDDQVTAFVEGGHDSNRGVAHPGELLLPGVGEMLQDGDEVGLLFYQQHGQFAALISVQQAPGVPGIVTLLPIPTPGLPVSIEPVASALNPVVGLVALPNPYNVTATDVRLPILIPGTYPGSRLTQR